MDNENNNINETPESTIEQENLDILEQLGIPVESTEETTVTPTPSSSLSDDDLNEILEDNGFSTEVQEDEEDDSEDDRPIDEILATMTEDDENTNETYHTNSGVSSGTSTEDLSHISSGNSDTYGENNVIDLARGRSPIITTLDGDEFVSTAEEVVNAYNEAVREIEEASEDRDSLTANSPTLVMDESTTRFSGAEWYKAIQEKRVIVAGVGGIGSWLALQLARLKPANITLYDDDTVEAVNMAGQLYAHTDFGKAKVDAIADTIVKYTSARQINAIQEKFTSNTETGDIMICGFDNMSARKTFFLSWIKHIKNLPEEKKKDCLYIDGRLDINTLQIFCIRGDDDYNMDRYHSEFLFSDAEADATVCSLKQTTYMACMIGSLMVNLFINFVAESLDPILPYDLPFFTEYDAQNMIFKTEH